jgi:TrmH family RNA methyltransferase
MVEWRGIVEAIRQVSSAKGRGKYGRFAIEGTRLHERALRAEMQLAQTVVAASFGSQEREAQLLTELGKVVVVPDEVMAELVDGRSLGHIISLIDMPVLPMLDEVLMGQKQPILLVAANVVDPGNVGALVRTGHASGVTALVAVGVSDPFQPKAVRTAMGSLFKVPIVRYEEANSLLADLRRWGIVRVGTAVHEGIRLPKAGLRGGTAVFMGNEYWGLPDELLAQMDVRVTIPMAEGVDSFSVNAAAAIILYELRRSE